MKRQRGRNRNNNNNNRNNSNRSMESNGPDVKVRGNVSTIYEKYTQLARDAKTSGNRVKAESLRQHAEHYLRLMNEQEAAREAEREAREAERAERDAESIAERAAERALREQSREVERMEREAERALRNAEREIRKAEAKAEADRRRLSRKDYERSLTISNPKTNNSIQVNGRELRGDDLRKSLMAALRKDGLVSRNDKTATLRLDGKAMTVDGRRVATKEVLRYAGLIEDAGLPVTGPMKIDLSPDSVGISFSAGAERNRVTYGRYDHSDK